MIRQPSWTLLSTSVVSIILSASMTTYTYDAFTIPSSSMCSKTTIQPLYQMRSSLLDADKHPIPDPSHQPKADKIISDIQSGKRPMPKYYWTQFHEEQYDESDDDDDPYAIDPETLGKWDVSDIKDNFDYEWDVGVDVDPNALDGEFHHVQEEDLPVDDDGVEIGYDPIFGVSHTIDTRTIVNPSDSYVTDKKTRDVRNLVPAFPQNDLEIQLNEDITKFRKSLKIIDTYVDPWLKLEVPRYSAKWHGYPEPKRYPDRPENINQFTKQEDKTDFNKLGPARARVRAVELARSKNNEWLLIGKSDEYSNMKTDVYGNMGLKVGSLMKGDIDEQIQETIQPTLDILGNVVELLEIINNTVFRFHYYGLIKDKRGMAAWTKTLVEDCGVDCTGVVFETGWRKRDPWHDGGDRWFGPY